MKIGRRLLGVNLPNNSDANVNSSSVRKLLLQAAVLGLGKNRRALKIQVFDAAVSPLALYTSIPASRESASTTQCWSQLSPSYELASVRPCSFRVPPLPPSPTTNHRLPLDEPGREVCQPGGRTVPHPPKAAASYANKRRGSESRTPSYLSSAPLIPLCV